ncbi:hypothetical protein HID58_088739 [Brassica napus]|uniref:Uncharacterized protein n=1 Tax=Brassica napus TaxID=3708 RepID=A0ABQ7XX12_BRANA|nr:hypothetical protein HID58_088739 [Brassica napus]
MDLTPYPSSSGRFSDTSNPIDRFESIMRATQGALIVASTLQMILGFSGLWRNVVRFLSPISAVPLVGLVRVWFPRGKVAKCVEIGLPELLILVFVSQYLPHVIKLGENVFDRFAAIFAVVIVWIYAHLFTVGGAYNGAAPTTQTSCRTDRAGIVGAAPWIRVPCPFRWGSRYSDIRVVWYWCWLLCLDVSISQMILDSCREIAGLLAALTRVGSRRVVQIAAGFKEYTLQSKPMVLSTHGTFCCLCCSLLLGQHIAQERLFDKGEHWWDKFYLSSTRIDEFYFLPF